MPIVESNNNINLDERPHKSVLFAESLIDQKQEESMFQDSESNYSDQPHSDENDAAGLAGINNEGNDNNAETNRTPPESPEINQQSIIDDGTGRRFQIHFQEHRLRFDQSFPDGLDMRIPVSEYEVALEQIHREFMEPLEKSQKSVRKWSIITASTAPIGVGYFLSLVLARRVHRHQKAFKNFWISLRQHLKALNREIYYARGIEWRIEKDLEKIDEREAYNKLHAFRIEIVFRKPISVRSGREIALRSTVQSRISSRTLSTIGAANNNNNRFSSSNFTDPELFALLSTTPGGEEYSYNSNLFINNPIGSSQLIEPHQEEAEEDRNVYSSPFFVPDHVVVPDEEEEEEEEEEDDDDEGLPVQESNESLLIKVQEPLDVKIARISSTYEPPSPLPALSVFSDYDSKESESIETKNIGRISFVELLREDEDKIEGEAIESSKSSTNKKLTFADLLLEDMDKGDKDSSNSPVEEAAVVGAVGLTAAIASSSLSSLESSSIRNSSPPNTPEMKTEETMDPARYSREEAFAQRQRKKFSRSTTLATQLYAIPESPTLGSEDPTGDAMNYLTQNKDEDDLIDDILGPATVVASKSRLMGMDELESPRPVTSPHFEDLGPLPTAAYPLADPFTPLYETDALVPVDPVDEDVLDETDGMEYTEVDGETEFIRRKKWRVSPERANKLSRAQTMTSESTHPSSRRSSYLPVTRTMSFQ